MISLIAMAISLYNLHQNIHRQVSDRRCSLQAFFAFLAPSDAMKANAAAWRTDSFVSPGLPVAHGIHIYII